MARIFSFSSERSLRDDNGLGVGFINGVVVKAIVLFVSARIEFVVQLINELDSSGYDSFLGSSIEW
jgi:hypothetical protein